MVKTMAKFMFLWMCLMFLNSSIICHGSLYDPQMFPEKGPFFEGWYMRFTDFDNKRTFGVLFGKVVPESEAHGSKLVFVGLIYDDNNTSKLLAYNAFPSPSVLNITTRGGHPVTKHLDVAGPADFRFDAGPYGYIEVKPDEAFVNITAENVHFEAHLGHSVAWDPKHEGPEGWLGRLPYLPLYWFVYSIRSPVISYSLKHLDTGVIISGSSGVAHMENNWGKSFPGAWIWSHGVTPDNVSYAMAFGPLKIGLLPVQGHLGGYRNPAKNIDIDFCPDNSVMNYSLHSCSGVAIVTVHTLLQKLVFKITANVASFSCLYGPMFNGFRKVCAESFKAVAEIDVFERQGLMFRLVNVDSQRIQLSALEFGGSFMCAGMCK